MWVVQKTNVCNLQVWSRKKNKNEKSCGPIGLLGYLSSVDDAHDPYETNWARFLCYCSACQVADLFTYFNTFSFNSSNFIKLKMCPSECQMCQMPDERSGSSTKGRTPNICYFVAIYTLFEWLSQSFQRKPRCFCRAFNERHPDFVELSTKEILILLS